MSRNEISSSCPKPYLGTQARRFYKGLFTILVIIMIVQIEIECPSKSFGTSFRSLSVVPRLASNFF